MLKPMSYREGLVGGKLTILNKTFIYITKILFICPISKLDKGLYMHAERIRRFKI